ncbi:chemotaxis protein CheW [Natronolimnohabitans innermongolicus]|uniref:Chemotaxis protein CheW n=1 Tax=Natronolimnohabitans innermongolicus JCM 12255 TaxID=1227499 RepID=L9XG84_9EURY|nr:chemotaxis protein CheW [Natronolimnohabitans innermongolicus]ELY60744.1 chemotaxis protein CheW [Natronolimnohabitans innermongolicus JCM 12255]
MAPDLSEKLLGIDIDGADDRTDEAGDDSDDDQEELEQFVFFQLGDHRLALPIAAVRTLAEVPDEMTRVPRTPNAIAGMIDLRGEITAVVEPRVHFPEIEADEAADSSGRERLLVLDRPADEQSAAIRADDVIGVETVPVSDVHDESTVEDSPLSGDSLEHPLVDALIEQAHERQPDAETGVSSHAAPVGGATDVSIEPADGDADRVSGTGVGAGVDIGTGSLTVDDESAHPLEAEDDRAVAGELEPTEAVGGATRTVVVEATPLLNVERLLLASGHREQPV